MTAPSASLEALEEAVQALSRRVEALEAEDAIRRRLTAYADAIDAGLERDWLDCFTEDGRFSVETPAQADPIFDLAGRAALAEYISRHSRRPGRFHQHAVVAPRVTVDLAAGAAHSTSQMFTMLRRPDGAPAIRLFGRYDDRLIRGADGIWRFRHRHAVVDAIDGSLPPLRKAGSEGPAEERIEPEA